MNSWLELHDSVIAGVEATDDVLRVVFSNVYIHRSEGIPGVDPGEGWVQPAELFFSQATWSGMINEFSGVLSDGNLNTNGMALNGLFLPFEKSGHISATFILATGHTLSVSAARVTCRCFGEARLVEKTDGFGKL